MEVSYSGCLMAGYGLLVSPPTSTSSPLRVVACTEEKTPNETPKEKQEEVKEIEMNVDQSINSAVINELFDGVLEQSDEEEEDEGDEEEEEEDALNISSMSLLTPLVETVASVVKSPERKMMVGIDTSIPNSLPYMAIDSLYKHFLLYLLCRRQLQPAHSL